ncbi:hypothetical protein A9Q84_13240 [Halobacteriovorax marinus]|uniref:Lipoprotein n=1 Tax=Halobacteriovorax marinus TaxID=97084 RepID=A0A1Y5F943_9BACT|nr:hypothetical protein A9Q84_13240 [Halobacteriovorax marinus]
MKQFAIVLIALLSLSSKASVEINCKAQSIMSGSELTVNITPKGDELLLTVIGGETPVAEYINAIVEEDMSNIKTLLACGELDEYEQEMCAYKYATDNGVLETRVFLDVQMMQVYESEGMGTFSIDKEKIASAVRYNIGEASKFGQGGVTVFFDKEGRVIGKLLNMLEVMDCK